MHTSQYLAQDDHDDKMVIDCVPTTHLTIRVEISSNTCKELSSEWTNCHSTLALHSLKFTTYVSSYLHLHYPTEITELYGVVCHEFKKKCRPGIN